MSEILFEILQARINCDKLILLLADVIKTQNDK